MWKSGFIFYLGICLILGNPVIRDDDVSYRLPRNVLPDEYTINIIPKMPTEEGITESTFQGKVQISATVIEETNVITLHAADMENIEYNVTDEDGNLLHKDQTFTNKTADYGFLYLPLNAAVKKNKKIKITINYDGYMRSDMYGFYLSSYLNKDNAIEYIGSTQMQPTHARRVFPCFDEPSFKAIFNIIVEQVPEEYIVLSNMRLDKNEKNKDNTTTFNFEKTPKMSTYLVAFVVSKFKSVKDNPLLDFNVWARPNAKTQAEFAQLLGPKMLDTLANYLNINYYKTTPKARSAGEMTKMEMIAIPDFAAGAMENWGLLTYRETALLYDEKLSTTKDKQRVACVIAHEQAHQWFGDLVTLTWWDNTWLNEGFATYFEYHTVAELKTDLGCEENVDDCWEMKKQFVIEEQQTALAADAIESSAPVTNPKTNSPNEIQGHFGAISYNKGGSVIRMMEHFLTKEIFKNGLTEYLTKNRVLAKESGNTLPQDLFDALQVAVVNSKKTDLLPKDKTVGDIMKNWIEKPGYPVVTVSDTYEIKQERFIIAHKETKATEEDEKSIWVVPIKYKTNGNDNKKRDGMFWLDTDNSTLSVTDIDWIILNDGSSGYYRVKYHKNILEKIFNILSNETTINDIPDIDRAQLVDDMLNLARAGYDSTTYLDTLNFLEYLQKEDNYYPWASAFSGFRFLMQRYSESDQTGINLRSEILKMMQGKLYKHENDIFNKPDNETLIETYSRVNALSWACNLGAEKCMKGAEKLFNEWKDNKKENKEIPVDVRSIVFCTALRNENGKTQENGQTPYFEYLWNIYKNSEVSAEKITILNALGCTKNADNIKIFMEYSLNETEVRKQDANYVFTSVYSGNDINIPLALDFLKEKWSNIQEQYGGMNALSKVVTGLADRLTTEDQQNTLLEFLQNKDVLKDVKDQVIETVEANLKWSKNRKGEIEQFLCEKDPNYKGCKSDDGGAAAYTASILTISLGLLALYIGKN